MRVNELNLSPTSQRVGASLHVGSGFDKVGLLYVAVLTHLLYLSDSVVDSSF